MKKKLKKIFITLLIAIVSYCTLTTTVNAVPQSIELGGTESIPGYVAGTYFTTKTTVDGDYMYCLNIHKYTAQNSTAHLVGELDAGVAYIMINGYPHKTFTGEKLKDYYITQTALWWYLDDTTGSSNLSVAFKTNGKDQYNLRPYIKDLVAKAKEAKSKGYAKTTISASISNETMSLSSDGKYFVSSEIAPTLTGAKTYKVSVEGAPSGTIVTDTNGASKDTFNSGDKFLVKIPANALEKTTTIKVKVSAVSGALKAYVLQPSDTSIQRLVTLYDDEVSKTVSLTAKLDKAKVCVDYVIVGDVKPNPDLTDPTPGRSCFDKGTSYNQEKGLTTRQEGCKFNGWYTKENLTGKWIDGTALNNNMTLYGAWDCGSVISVPNTASKLPLTILGVGLLIIAGGVAIIIYRDKKMNANK